MHLNGPSERTVFYKPESEMGRPGGRRFLKSLWHMVPSPTGTLFFQLFGWASFYKAGKLAASQGMRIEMTP